MSRRRKRMLAAGAVVVVVAIVLVATLGGGGASTGTATDRAQIAAVSLAYSQAIAAFTNPCSYLDPQSRAYAMARAKHEYLSPVACARVAEQLSGTPPEGVSPAGIVFGSGSQRADCSGIGSGPDHGLPASQRGLPWATAAWAGGDGEQGTFVREDGRWWVDVLICPGAGS